jgi:hypothetical protein
VALVAGPAGDAFSAVMHRKRIPPFKLLNLLLGHNLREKTVTGAFPHARIPINRPHPVTVSRMGPPDLTERIRST